MAILGPEHGASGTFDQANVPDGTDEETGVPVKSLYGATKRPTPDMLADVDTIVFDIQDIGCRFYTYCLHDAGGDEGRGRNTRRPFVVLDRPNPIDGVSMAGPLVDAGAETFVGCHPIPLRHGMTVGELAKMFAADLKLDLDLTVIPCEGWRRSDAFDATGLEWVNPSPNMRSLTEAFLYPGIGLLEFTNLSVGRGTDTPFEVIGAPWLDGRVLADALAARRIPGVGFVPIRFTPSASKFKGEQCGGVNIVVTDRGGARSCPRGARDLSRPPAAVPKGVGGREDCHSASAPLPRSTRSWPAKGADPVLEKARAGPQGVRPAEAGAVALPMNVLEAHRPPSGRVSRLGKDC